MQKKKRPWQGEANKGQRQELVGYLVGQAKQQGYLLVTPETPKLATDYFRHWCKQALHPAITVELRGACATVIADTGPVGTGLEAQGKLWRSDPWPTLASLVAMRRKTGAQKASWRRAQNEQARQNEFAMVEGVFSEWEHHEFPELAAVFRLAYWTMWASRWAKENHVRGIKAVKHQALYEQRRERWYARKDEALKVLASSSYARIAFYRPDQADKITLSLCDGHYQRMRRGFYEGKRDFYDTHTKEIKACPWCHVIIELDYYSLYSFEIVADVRPDMHFAFHIPYLSGVAFLPLPHSLPHVTQTEEEDGLFRFGRRLEEGEKILYREKDVETQFTQALTEARRLFSSVETSSYSEKKPGKDRQ